jgi:hypothetical protein
MPLTIADAEDALLYANAEFEEWKAQLVKEWFGPLGQAMLGALVKQAPLKAFEGLDPMIVAELRQKYGGDNA